MSEPEMKPVFSPQQIEDWKVYERVRKSGVSNMFFPEAREISGLTKERYFFCIKWYSALKEAANE